MKQFLSLSFMCFLLLVLPGCICKKECHPKVDKQKREKKQYYKKQHQNKKQSNRYAATEVEEEEIEQEYVPEEYDADQEPIFIEDEEVYDVPVEDVE